MKTLATKVAVGLVQWWVHLYTLGMGHAVADARRAEVESDLWECLHDRRSDADFSARSIEILGRLVRGVPADLAWSMEERRPAVSRSKSVTRGMMRMGPTVAAAVGVFFAVLAVVLLLFFPGVEDVLRWYS